MSANYETLLREGDRVEVRAWRGWGAGDRESFFAAIARHRRAAWRVTLVSVLANAVIAVTLSVLMAPIFYAVLMALLDLINLAIPMPNVADHWLRFVVWASLPGLFWFGLVFLGLHRRLRVAGLFAAGEVPARTPNPYVLVEQRLASVIAEMAIAANVPQPRVLIAPPATLNAAVLGPDPQHATIVISQTLLTRLNRAELHAVAAHLIACIANGDLRAGMRVAQTLGLLAVFGGTWVLGPLIALVWRRRKYLADATAVRLTRDPDALGQALQKVAAARDSRATIAPTLAHLAIVQADGGTAGPFSGVVPMFPSLARRLHALATLGAHLDREPTRPERS
jgi:Zn-dependent protease with chaperone function